MELELIELKEPYPKRIDTFKLYDLISTGITELDDLISRLEKDSIFGENPQNHCNRNKLECKLELKDPEFRIVSKKIEATSENIKEFEMHIKELQDLKVIRKSVSPHRSPAFIVNKHSEQVRGKSRMIIDFHELKVREKS